MDEKAMLDELETRTAALLLFRRLFEAELDRITADAIATEKAADAISRHASTKSLQSVSRTLSQHIDDERLEAMRDEYTRMFVGPAKLEAPFWESVYLDDRELLFLESTSKVRRFYEQEGLRVSSDSGRVAEDSLPFELDFLATLSQRSLDALACENASECRRLLNVQRRFEEEHMADWLPMFAGRAAKAGRPVFYPTLCQAVSDFISEDTKTLTRMAE